MDGQELLSRVARQSDETEFYTPMPAGYKPGKTRYVIVVGTVMSGLGKGIFSSSLAKLMQDRGLVVSPIKLEGYLNIDSGTLNPFRHGEVFVLDDGMETDMDLGTYERMLDKNLTRDNFATSGQIFTRVLERERRGGYLGRDVQWIPHVTGEVKARIRELAVRSGADVVFVEIGGTVGDYENSYYIEAMRELAFEEGPNSTIWVALTYVMQPPALGEQKSKAAQLGIKRLMEAGVQPAVIACRCETPVTEKVREKISLYTNVPMARVFSMHDCKSIYEIPQMIRKAGLDAEAVRLLELEPRTDAAKSERFWTQWQGYVEGIRNVNESDREVVIGITGKYTALRDSYASIIKALEHAGVHYGVRVEIRWIDTSDLDDTPGKAKDVARALEGVHGIIVPGGFGARGSEGKIACIHYARENGLPYLGICFGFQMAVLEFARNVCGLPGAYSSELEKRVDGDAVIDILPEQKRIEGLGGNMRLGGRDIELKPGTMAHEMFGRQATFRMRFRHRYEVDPRYIETLESHGMVFSGKAPDQPIMQILELPGHPYFIGTQAHPCLTSRPLRPQPMFMGLVRTSAERAGVPVAEQAVGS
ncbi:MAG: CTP synthase [Phycisphaerae bacterium]|nr:CTP synthase [Phycisphaerae bacterium]